MNQVKTNQNTFKNIFSLSIYLKMILKFDCMFHVYEVNYPDLTGVFQKYIKRLVHIIKNFKQRSFVSNYVLASMHEFHFFMLLEHIHGVHFMIIPNVPLSLILCYWGKMEFMTDKKFIFIKCYNIQESILAIL